MSENYWYSLEGISQDVVVSTRVRLARNLVNFPFPVKFCGDDGDRVRILIFDAFSKIKNPDDFQTISCSLLNETNKNVFIERGILSYDLEQRASEFGGIVLRTDGKVCCSVNEEDHLRISSFVSGFDAEKAFRAAKNLDDDLQKFVQFAATYEFGFLTSSVQDSGSGMKVSCRLHLPSLTFLDQIAQIVEDFHAKNLVMSATYGVGFEKSCALGDFYQISASAATFENETEQIAALVGAISQLIELERKARTECLEKNRTILYNKILRSFALSKFSIFLDLREGLEILSKIKWGVDLRLIEGISDVEIFSLLYGIQKAHLQFIIKNTKFACEEDILNDENLVVNRARALIIREAMEKAKIKEE